jgi:hypothetical protein
LRRANALRVSRPCSLHARRKPNVYDELVFIATSCVSQTSSQSSSLTNNSRCKLTRPNTHCQVTHASTAI